MDVVERIKAELNSSPVVLFMKGTPDFPQCGFSAQTVAALRAVGAQFKHVNIFEEPELREALKRFSNWPTYPQLYVNGELVGGCDIALQMYKSGELHKLVAEAGGDKYRAARRAACQRSVTVPSSGAACGSLSQPSARARSSAA
jgi:monothiol glutaredoxin